MRFTRQYGGLREHGLVSQILRVTAASAVMGVACRVLSQVLRAHFQGGGWTLRLVETLPPIALGAALYFGLCYALRVEETRQAARLVTRPLRRLGLVR